MSTSTRHPNANTVHVDADRFRHFFYMQRLPLTSIGPLFDRCEGWASTICHKGHAGYFALDELAASLGMPCERPDRCGRH